MRMSKPSNPSSIMLARNMPASSAEKDQAFVRFAASSVITRMRRIEAIRPTTRNGSVTKKWERMDIRTVCKISTSISTTSSWSNTCSVSAAIVQ